MRACRMGQDALGKLVPLRPYPDGDKNIMACPPLRERRIPAQ